ncbi:MAG: AAA domain-containing protein [Bacillota bacterium]
MPLKKDPLLEELSLLRDHLKAAGKDEFDRTPIICSDDALIEIAKREPLKLDDFKAISGIGDVFIANYGEAFLRVVLKHKNNRVKQVRLSRTTSKVLNTYKDRLTNISRRNRNLYTTRLSNRLGVDLTRGVETAKLSSFIHEKTSHPLRLTYKKDASLSKEEETFYRHLTLLYRDLNRTQKDKGAYDLFIAYPFVLGKLEGEAFEVKAPLLFFPVILERKGYDFYLKMNKEKDVLLNRDLLLANNKFNHFDDIKNIPSADLIDADHLYKTIIPFYGENHISIQKPPHVFNQFEAYEPTKKEDFKKVKTGHLEIKNYIVLGRFSMYSSKLQEDIKDIIGRKSYNDLLEGLLEDRYKTYDYSQDTTFKRGQEHAFKERDLTYINTLNYSQEQVINLLDKHEKLVIWGPPGTGKSQTITSLIASQIEKGENVLIVSEKKVALDVIHSRLGNASRFTLFMDDAQDKNAFYAQVKNHIDPLPPTRSLNNDRDTVDDAVDKIIGKLKRMHHAFYTPQLKDIETYKLYPRYLSEKQINDILLPLNVYETFMKHFNAPTYQSLSHIEKTFSNAKKLRNLITFLSLKEIYPIIDKLNFNLTRSEKIKRTKFYKLLEEFKETYNSTFFLFKRKKRREFIKAHESDINFFFTKKRHRKAFLTLLIKEDRFYQTFKKVYHSFALSSAKLKKLNNASLTYLEMLMHDPLFTEIEDVYKYHTAIFDAFYTGYIETFEAANQDKVYDLNQYKELMEKLDDLIIQKEGMSKETFTMELYKHALSFSNTKRIMDIKRRLDASRKWSVSKFINAFQLELFSNIKVWLMTPEVVSEIIPLNFAMFDLAIFDEASQMYVEKAIPTIYRAKKVVIAGDTKQLRPSSLGQGRLTFDDDLYEEDDDLDITIDAESLLDLARYKYKETILNYHYRSKYEELISFSNYAFYDGKLLVSPNQIIPKTPPIEYIVCEDGVWDNRSNLAEAKKVIELIKKTIRLKTKEETIGVITFNTQQRNLVEDLLDEELFTNTQYKKRIARELNRFEDGEDRSLFVKNIENVQGDERDIIIFTTAYAKNTQGRFLRQFGWLNNEGGQNRLNVAISRAKKKVYIVTSFYPQNFHVEDLKSIGPKRLKEYLTYCYHVSNKDSAQASSVLMQLSNVESVSKTNELTALQEDIYKRLDKEDYTVDTNIGIGKYTIDFGLFDDDTKTYKLGIICDVKENGTAGDVRDVFYHQEKYLHARGWTIYRIFAPAWYKDANKIMRDVRKLLKQ